MVDDDPFYEPAEELLNLLNRVNFSDEGYDHLLSAFKEIASGSMRVETENSSADYESQKVEEDFLTELKRVGARDAHFKRLTFLLQERSKDDEVHEVILEQPSGEKLVIAVSRRNSPVHGSKPGDLMRIVLDPPTKN